VAKLCIGGERILQVQAWYGPSIITMPRLVRLGYRTPPGGEKVRRFLFVRLSITLLNDRVCECHFAINAFEFKNDLGIVG